MKRKIIGILSTILIVSGMLPIGIFAKTTLQEGAIIQEATLKHSNGSEITAENPIEVNEIIEVEMKWLVSDTEIFSVTLPNNLIFEEQDGNIENSNNSYTVKNNQLFFYETEKRQTPIISITLKASTNGKNLINEIVDFGNNVTKTIFYMTEDDKTSDPITQKIVMPQVIKEVTPEIKNVLLEKSDGSGGWSPIEDGDSQLTTKSFRLSVDWEILDSSTIQSGDYMEIKLPSILRLTDVPASALNIKVEGQDYHVGTYELYKVTDASGNYDYSVFRVVFNDTIAKEKISSIENGYFRYTGLFNKELSKEELVTIGDFELPSFSIGKNPDKEINFTDTLYKQGYQALNTNRLQWSVQVNMDDVTSIYKGGKASSEIYSNAVFVDELEEGLTFLREQVGSDAVPFPYRAGVSIYKVLPDGTVTDSRIGSVLMNRSNYHDVADSIDMSSIDTAKEDIKNHPVGSFAIYVDDVTKKETLLIHLGEIPDSTSGAQAGLVFDRTWEYMENMINSATSMTDEEKVATLAALRNLYDESNGTWSIGYTIEMQAQADSSVPSDHRFSNTAHLYYDNGDMTSNESAVIYQKSDAGGEGKVPKNAIEIVKKDKDTNQPIANVQFEVVEYDGNQEGAQVGTLITDVDGKATLGNLKVGKYKIKEISGLDNYDPKMIIENQTNLTTDGIFEISASDSEGFSFDIYNKRLSGTVDLNVKKKLTGSTLQSGDFEFTLLGHGENQTKTNTNEGDVKFDSIDYDAPGTYIYTIEETQGNSEGITYDPKKITATVTVKKEKDKLETSVIYTDDDGDDTNVPEEFVNKYVKPQSKPTELILEAQKTLSGKELSSGDFEFKLTGHGEDQTKTNDQNGKIKFDSIEFDTAGTYVYMIEEVAGKATGITYDQKKVTATVTVKENSKNELETSVIYTDDDGDDTNTPEEFVNKYIKPQSKPTELTLEAQKILSGKDLSTGEFEFKLTGHGEDQTKTNAKNGKIKFDSIEFDTVGTYVYTIEEVAGKATGITYDQKKVITTVTVKENSKNELEASVNYTDDDGDDTNTPEEFVNKYIKPQSKPTELTLEVQKILNGKELYAGDFEFKLTGHGEDQTKTNTKDGKVKFDSIEFDTAGTYVYEIVEVIGKATGIIYDQKKVTATVTVKENSKNELIASVIYTDDDGTNTPEEFVNEYIKPQAKPTKLTLEVQKILNGKKLYAGEFEFKLTGQGEVQTKANAKNGKVKFDSIEFDTAGTYVYSIEEVTGKATGITYDQKKVTATVTVEENSKNELEARVLYSDDDGDDTNRPEKFVNKYTEPKKVNGKITIVKIDGDSADTLEGAEFELRDADNKVITIGGKTIGVTGKNGKLTINNLTPGKYTLTEVKAPTGYELDGTAINFEIKSDSSSDFEKNLKEIKNHQKKNGVVLKKVDNKDHKKTLKGAEFELQDTAGKIVSGYEKLVTDENGLIYLHNLPKGDYQFVEKKAPKGYKLDSEPVKISVKNARRINVIKENVLLTIEKDKLPNTNKTSGNSGSTSHTTAIEKLLPNTGEQQNPFIWIGILCLLSAGEIYFSRKKGIKGFSK